MKILVTGAAGFIGSHLAERLAGTGHSVVGVDSLTPYYSRALKELNAAAIRSAGVAFHPLDLVEDDLGPVLRDVEVVYHLAAQPGLSPGAGFQLYLRNNVVATERLLAALQGAPGLRGMVYVSTSSVYGADATGAEDAEPKPTSMYGVTKLAAEQLALSHFRSRGFPACSVRLFSVYGPRERPEKLYPTLIRSLLEDRPFPLYEGSEHHLRSYTYVGDAVDGLVSVLEKLERCAGEIFNLGMDSAMSTGEGIRIVEEIVGRRARIVREPRRAGDQTRTEADIRKARRVLGYEPRTTPREGLAREVEWYRTEVLGKVLP